MIEKQLCLIGAGRIARVHARSVMALPGCRIAAVVDPVQPVGETMAAHVGGDWHATFDEACASSRFDGVIVAAPTATHADLIEICVSRDLPVLCEKPVDLELRRVDACLDVVRRSGVPVLVAFHRYFDAARREVHATATSGAIGRIEHVLQISRDPRLPEESFIEHSGGMVRDMIIHDLAELVLFCGAGPVSVQADLRRYVDPALLAQYDDADSAVISVVFDDGPQCQISATRRCAYGFDQRLEVFGSLGLVSCPNVFARATVTAVSDGFHFPRLLDHFPERYAAAYASEMSHFLDILNDGRQPICTVADARAALALAELVLQSARTRTTARAERL